QLDEPLYRVLDREGPLEDGAAGRTERGPPRRISQQAHDGIGQLRRLGGVDEQRIGGWLDDLAHRRYVVGDDGKRHGHRFDLSAAGIARSRWTWPFWYSCRPTFTSTADEALSPSCRRTDDRLSAEGSPSRSRLRPRGITVMASGRRPSERTAWACT